MSISSVSRCELFTNQAFRYWKDSLVRTLWHLSLRKPPQKGWRKSLSQTSRSHFTSISTISLSPKFSSTPMNQIKKLHLFCFLANNMVVLKCTLRESHILKKPQKQLFLHCFLWVLTLHSCYFSTQPIRTRCLYTLGTADYLQDRIVPDHSCKYMFGNSPLFTTVRKSKNTREGAKMFYVLHPPWPL